MKTPVLQNVERQTTKHLQEKQTVNKCRLYKTNLGYLTKEDIFRENTLFFSFLYNRMLILYKNKTTTGKRMNTDAKKNLTSLRRT